MPSSRFFIVIATLTALMLIVGTAMAQGTTDRQRTIDPTQVKEGLVKEVLDSNGKVINPHRQLASVSQEHGGGFGGFYFSDDKGTVYFYMEDLTKTAAATDAFNAAYNGRRAPTEVVVVQAQYSLDDLVEWFYRLDKALVENEIHPSTGSVLKGKNRIQFGLMDASEFDAAREVMGELGIPEGAVDFVVQGYATLLSHDPGLRQKTVGLS